MTKPLESSGGEIQDISNKYDVFGTIPPKIESSDLNQHPVFGKFTITATGDYVMNIGFIPSFIELTAFESGQITNSVSVVKSNYNICRAVDNASAQTEPALNTVVYLSRAGLTSATIKQYGLSVKINCATYTHNAIINWIAYP